MEDDLKVEGPLTLAEKVQMFEDAEQATRDARAQAERCRDYYDNKQLTSEEVQELRKRGQPEVIRNKIKRKVNFLLGYEASTRSDPKGFPRNPGDEDAAEAVTSMLRFQEQKAKLDQKLSDVWENMIIEGFGALEVMGPSRADPRVIEVKRWKWDRVFYDPHSSEHDFSDAMYMGGFIWKDEAEALREYPEAAEVIKATASAEQTDWGRTYDDRPRTLWVSQKRSRKRIRLVQMYYRIADQWYWCIFTKGGDIDGGPVEFRDENGFSECPMLLQSAYVDRENQRYGEVVELLSTQDEVNKRASKSLHLLNSTLTIGEQGAVLDVDKIKSEKARPDGHIELPPGGIDKFKFVEHNEKVAGHLELLQLAEAHLEQSGPNASLTGTRGGAPSGRAIRAEQEGGLVELGRLKDRHTSLKERVYRSTWNRCRQFMTDETWVNVTDDDDNVKFVGFNVPETMEEQLVREAKAEGVPEEEIAARLEEAKQDPMTAYQLSQVVGMARVPAEMDVDVIIEPAGESITMAEENFQALMGAFPPGTLPPEVVVEVWPGDNRTKRKIKEHLEKSKPSPQQMQRAEAADAMQGENLAADTEVKRSTAAKNMAQAQAALAPPAPPAGAFVA